MASHFSTRIFHHRRNPLFHNLLLKSLISSFSTFAAAENQSHLFLYTKTFSQTFKECSKQEACEPGRQAHSLMIVSGFKPTVFVSNILLQMYVKCSRLQCAAKVFDRMPQRNCMSWTAMLFGYSVNGEMGSAQSLFDLMPERDVVSWNSLMSGYLQNGNFLKSVEVFVMMGRDDVAYNVTSFSVVLKAIASLEDCVLGKQVHGNVVKLGFECEVVIGTALLSMYAKCSMLRQAQQIFVAMPLKSSVSWSAIISGCIQHGKLEIGIKLYREMQRESVEVTQSVYASVFKSCAGLCDSTLGSQLHAHALKHEFGANIVVGTAILDMYAKCDNLQNARKVFNLLPTRVVESYNALMVGYGRRNRGFEAIRLFRRLLNSDLGFDEISLSAAFSACAVSKGLTVGTQIHGLAIKTPFHYNIAVATAILNMYGKCGALPEAWRIFDEMKSRDVFTWNAMVCAGAHHGYGNEVVKAFEKMLLLDKVKPDLLTFTGVLHACAHDDLVDEAVRYLGIMQKDYRLSPQLEHYSCVVDALGRSGRITDALKLIQDMPLKANGDIWTSLLSNCKMNGNVEVAEMAVRNLIQLDPQDLRAYVLLSDVYAVRNEALKTRRVTRSSGLGKEPNCSWIAVEATT